MKYKMLQISVRNALRILLAVRCLIAIRCIRRFRKLYQCVYASFGIRFFTVVQLILTAKDELLGEAN